MKYLTFLKSTLLACGALKFLMGVIEKGIVESFSVNEHKRV